MSGCPRRTGTTQRSRTTHACASEGAGEGSCPLVLQSGEPVCRGLQRPSPEGSWKERDGLPLLPARKLFSVLPLHWLVGGRSRAEQVPPGRGDLGRVRGEASAGAPSQRPSAPDRAGLAIIEKSHLSAHVVGYSWILSSKHV